MWTILSLLNKAAQYFADNSIPSSRLEAEILLAHSLALDRISLYTQYSRPVETDEVDRYRALVKRRIKGEPSAYLTGKKEFYSLPFLVSPSVLIPRPETEDLVQAVLDAIPDDGEGVKVADLGAGSGCIVVTLCKLKKMLHAAAVDKSKDALEVAEKNSVFHGVENRISFHQGDMCEPLLNVGYENAFNVIACNPPYVDPEGPHPFDPHVKEWEPHDAVFSPPGDPLFYYRKILRLAGPLLAADGRLIFEIGIGMAKALSELAKASGWSVVAVKKDLAQIERTVSLKLDLQKE